MSIVQGTDRLVVVSGWGVPVEMLAELYGFWPGPVELVSLDDALVSRCDSVAEVADELLSRYREPSVWMGWSLGAQVVMEAACRDGGAVAGVITLAGFPRFLSGECWPYGMSAERFEAFRDGLVEECGRAWLRFLLLMISGSAESRLERRCLKSWLDKGPEVAPHNLLKSLEWLWEKDQRSLWAQLDRPTLHILGECDQVVSSWSDGLDLPPSAAVTCISGMAHWPGGVFAQHCREAIETFLEPSSGGASSALSL